MTTAIDCTWLDARIARTKELIVAYEDAIAALGEEGIQSYTLNTGQTTQSVTRANLTSLQSRLDSLENRLATLSARRYGTSRHMVPGW